MSYKETIKNWPWRIKKAGLTQSEMSAMAGVAQSTLTNYIKGKITPSLHRYEKIEAILKSRGA